MYDTDADLKRVGERCKKKTERQQAGAVQRVASLLVLCLRKMRLLMGLAIARNWIIKPKQEDTKFLGCRTRRLLLPSWVDINICIRMLPQVSFFCVRACSTSCI